MEIRTLRREEREDWLELLNRWELADGWQGREFFRRWIEHDPTYEDEWVFVAVEAGRLVSTVQVFPRQLRVAGKAVPIGGIGSVFTDESARKRGLAGQLLQRSVEAMEAHGMDISLLFGVRPFYTALGWPSWGVRMSLLKRTPDTALPESPGEMFRAERDLADVRALHESYTGSRDGNTIRDDALWSMSLQLAGNPDEEFRVARRGKRVVAYARAVVLYGVLTLMELARTPDAAGALADLVLEIQSPREEDPHASPEHPSAELRRVALTVDLSHDPTLQAALAERGLKHGHAPDPSVRMRCLNAPRLAKLLGIAQQKDETPNDFLQRLLPPDRFVFWQSDRF